MLVHFGITPYIVFDGDYLPSKAATESERAGKRAESKRVGLELYRMGKPSQAHLELQKAVDVTPEMARQFIEQLKINKIQYVVAPYEADAQLAYLERKGMIQGIISEDSDLLVFGAKRLLTKLDQHGDCVEINRDDFTACKEISLVGWSDAEFRRMAILSGCDYLASINNMGLKTAYRLVRKYKSIERVVQILQFDGKYRVPSGYLDDFRRAELTFLHQRVFCPAEMKLVMTTDLENGPEHEDFAFIGKLVEADIALGVAKGDLHPMTKRPIIVNPKTPKTFDRQSLTSRSQPIGTPLGIKSKSIESFFKAQRTPLAELDPNSFTPSPSQRQLLAQQTRTWSATPAPSYPPQRQSTSSLPASTQSAELDDADRAHGSSHVWTSRSYPSKRQRLCGDDTIDDAMLPPHGTKVETGRSRFFATSVPNPSPSTKRSNRNKSATTPINIWSDDSIDEVMLGLPDIPDNISKACQRNKVTIFEDSNTPVGKISKCDNNTTSQVLQVSTEGSHVTRSLGSVLPTNYASTSGGARKFPAPCQVKENHGSVQKTPASDSYNFDVAGKAVMDARYAVTTDSAIQASPLRAAPLKSQLDGSGSMSTLQRLQRGTLYRSRSCESSAHLIQKSKPKSSGTIDSIPFIPGVPNYSEHVTPPDAKGSEDFMVPNSEEEESEDTLPSPVVERQAKSKLNLDRFTFNG